MDYIEGLFITDSKQTNEHPLSDVSYHTIETGLTHIQTQLTKGLSHFLLFGVTADKSVSAARSENAIIPSFIREVKKRFGDAVTIHADVGISPYTQNGESVLYTNKLIDETKTTNAICKLAISFATAGADFVCPVIPFDSQVHVVRNALDTAGFQKTKIHSYSAKYASSLYGPYMKTVNAKNGTMETKNYYLDPMSTEAGLQKALSFEQDGADLVMVKPATWYLDVIHQITQKVTTPVSAYHVSGEYMMLKVSSKAGIVNEDDAFDEVHSAFYRAGVSFVIGYAPNHFLRWRNTTAK